MFYFVGVSQILSLNCFDSKWRIAFRKLPIGSNNSSPEIVFIAGVSLNGCWLGRGNIWMG